MEYGLLCKLDVNTCKTCFTGFTGVQPLRIEERNLWTLLFIYSVSTSPVGWRLTRKISSIMPDTLIIMDYRRQFFMCLSLLMVSVIPELKGRFLNFSDDPLFSTFTGNGKVGSNYGIRMVVKNLRSTWWLLHFPALLRKYRCNYRASYGIYIYIYIYIYELRFTFITNYIFLTN